MARSINTLKTRLGHDFDLQALEDRVVMASSITPSMLGSVLYIEGTPYSDEISVRQQNGNIAVSGKTIKVNGIARSSVPASSVTEIRVSALGGNDVIDLDSGRLTGYQPIKTGTNVSCSDGQDTVSGAAGIDVIYGGNGDDNLGGGDGNDVIYGDAGNDRLNGNFGNDRLYGGDGNDGLLGGVNVDSDSLTGGAGADRFCWSAQGSVIDVMTDKAAEDVGLRFSNGNRNWDDAEVNLTDKAFELMQDRVGGTWVLKRANGTELNFVRDGSYYIDGKPTAGLNQENGVIRVYDVALTKSDQNYTDTIVHETAHNWDDPNEMGSSNYSAWGKLSGWIVRPNSVIPVATPAGYEVSTDGEWWYKSTSGFAWNYGRTNPYEDFTVHFARYFVPKKEATAPFQSKLDFVDRWLDAKTRYVQLPGSATDISVGANGTAWCVNGAGNIYKFNGSNWAQVAGNASRIAVAPDGNAWVVNSAGQVYKYDGQEFDLMPGSGVTDIGIGANGAVWCINSGGLIYVWANSDWSQVAGSATRIAVDAQGSAWVVNSAGNIYHYVYNSAKKQFQFEQVAGNAKDIAVGADGTVWCVNSSGNLYRKSTTAAGDVWNFAGSGVSAVTVDPTGNVWYVGTTGGIFRRG